MPRTAAARKSVKVPRKSAPAKPSASAADKERPLVEDIRLLGRLLGEVIREQEGLAAFELIERVRQLSVAYRIHKDASAGRVLDRLLHLAIGNLVTSNGTPRCLAPPPPASP